MKNKTLYIEEKCCWNSYFIEWFIGGGIITENVNLMKIPYVKSFNNVFDLGEEEIILNDIMVFGFRNWILEKIPFRIEKINDKSLLYPLNEDFKSYIIIANRLIECTSVRIDKSKFFQIYEDDKDYIVKVEK